MDMSRREFVKNSAGLAAVAATGLAPLRAAEQAEKSKMIGIQVGSVSFVDEGVGKVLDILQERAAVDTVFLTTFTYGRGLAGRQIPGYPFPDHRVQESDTGSFHGGNYATPHPEFYSNRGCYEFRLSEMGKMGHFCIFQRESVSGACRLRQRFRTQIQEALLRRQFAQQMLLLLDRRAQQGMIAQQDLRRQRASSCTKSTASY